MAKLPPPRTIGTMSVEEALHGRRSKRSFSRKGLSPEQISQLLWSGQGMVGRGLRTAPSAGATYPLELYLVTAQGVYHYRPETNEIEPVLEGDVRPQLCRACLGQEWIEGSPVSIVIAGVYERTAQRYGPRTSRYVHMEAGHAAQNIHLQAVALELGSVPVGAFRDEQVQKVLCFAEDHHPLYIISVGYSAE